MKSDKRKNIKKNLSILSYNRLFTGIGYYLFVPLLSIILLNIGLQPHIVGILVALFSFATKGGGAISLIFPKCFIYEKRIISFGTLLAAIGLFSIFILHGSTVTISFLIFITGIGISLNLLSIQTYISNHVIENNKKFSSYTLQIWIANVTAIAGPIIANYLIKRFTTLPLFISGIFYLLAFLNTQLFFKSSINYNNYSRVNISQILKEIWNNHKFKLLLFISFLMWFIYGQLYFILPLYVKTTLHLSNILGYLFGFNSLILVLLQGIVNRSLQRLGITENFRKNILVIGLGFLSIGLGFFLILMSSSLTFLVWLGIFFLSLGELLNMPLLDLNISNVRGHLTSPQFFAIYTIICGIGYGLSSLIFSYFTKYIHIGLIILVLLSIISFIILNFYRNKI
ncbi:MFS transporter [Bombilactobacillus bombi]|uniref:MFS transporter n=1 Tax=Bombilactobacillus bombi TaxID=1303590 RepID=UPI0013C3166E|nr:MFS transporter [Bombilactobacillus bombi]